ncbi:hypothetical protein PUR71_39165 [Streptomyces sp. SP17BM10]|uniref:hypothetical protein n=1 Tax=Streptomyces sp. SP17BM10 TaxID=3002530 RepID=UPI002E779A2F|nr:hypothetical protein [Streptomyces sp. SP17BM10]MEE1788880.1 hypothetical protein [Streptomyces sp. SP17BM10]
MSAEDGFEEELVRRLGLRAAAVGGSPPLAALKAAGRRRARQQGAVRGVTAVAVLAVGAGALTQLGGGGTPSGGGLGVGGGPAGAPSASAGRDSGTVRPLYACNAGPSSLRTPGMHFHPTDLPTGPPRITPSFTPSSTPWSGSPSFTPPSPPPTPSFPPSSGSPSTLTSAQVSQAELARAGEAVDRMATAGYPDRYFGICRDAGLNTVYVMRVPGDGALDEAVTRVLAGWPAVRLQFTDAVGSYGELTELRDRIDGDRAYWQDKGVKLEFVQVAHDGSGVVVDTPQWESAGAQIKARYGPKVVEVR